MSGNRPTEVREFLQAIAHQLDLAQDALRVKVQSGRPLTWALKDLDIDLKVFVEMGPDAKMRWRTAGPNETGASTVKLSFTTITRDVVEENTFAWEREEDPRGLDALKGELDESQRRHLDLLGVRTVGQYRRVASRNPRAVQASTGIPTLDLQAALRRSARPAITGHSVEHRPDGQRLVRIQGANLDREAPEVLLAGEPVEVLEASSQELLVRPLAHHDEGEVEVRVGNEHAKGWFRVGKSMGPANQDAWDGASEWRKEGAL